MIQIFHDHPPPPQIVLATRGLAARLVALLDHSASSVQTPALRAVGNVITGSDAQTQAMIDRGVVAPLTRLLGHGRRGIRKEACWALSNVTAGTADQIDAVIAGGALPRLVGARTFFAFHSIS